MPSIEKQKNNKKFWKKALKAILPLLVLGASAVMISWINFGLLQKGVSTKGIRGGTISVFPADVAGEWDGTDNALGDPDVGADEDAGEFTNENSAVYQGGAKDITFTQFNITGEDLESKTGQGGESEMMEGYDFEENELAPEEEPNDKQEEIVPFDEDNSVEQNIEQESIPENNSEGTEPEEPQNDSAQLDLWGAKTALAAQVLNLEQIEKSNFEGARIFLSFAAGENRSQASSQSAAKKSSWEKLGGIFNRQAKASSDEALDLDFDTAMMLKYSVDGKNWQELDFFSEGISNRSNSGYFNYDADLITSWDDLNNLQIRIEGLMDDEPRLLGFLDSVWVQVKYGSDEQPEEKLQIFSDKRAWRKDEHPNFRIEDPRQHDSFLEMTRDKIVSPFQSDPELSVKLKNNQGEEFDLEKYRDYLVKNEGPIEVELLPNNELPPGNYTLDVKLQENGQEQIFEGSFAWGLLAVNFNKSVYLENETAHIQLAALDENGHTRCDANLQVEIIEPKLSNKIFRTSNGTIEKSGTCGPNNVTDIADYFFHYEAGGEGTYDVIVTNLDNDFEIADQFEVIKKLPFEVERVGATRINPFESTYEMNFNIKANEDFEGNIIETVPENFEIEADDHFSESGGDEVKYITWENVEMEKGEIISFSYSYQAPEISPMLYLLGPLRLESSKSGLGNWLVLSDEPDFKEARSWQIASDAAGDVDIGRWTGGTTSLIPTTSWAAPNGMFSTQARNDNSTYTFTDSTASVDIGTVDADGYLLVAAFEFEDTSNGRFNPQGRFVQTSGTGTFVSAYTSGYDRDTSEDRAFVRTWAFVDGPSAGSDFQFQWKRDVDSPTGGTVMSSFDIIPLYYGDFGVYSSTSAALYGGTTPNVVTGFTGTDGTNITISSNVVTVAGDNKRYLVLGSWFLEGFGTRTQRIGGFDIDGTQLLPAQGYAYARNASNDEVGAMMTHLMETSTADQTIEMTLYRGDGVGANQGGADVDGSTPSVGQHALAVIELNDTAEVFHSTDGTGGVDLNVTGPVDISIAREVDITFNDTASFTRASDTAMDATVTMDALVGANLWAAQEVVTTTSRWTARAHITVNGTEDTDTRHGNYARNDQGSIDTFGWSANLMSFVALSSGDDLGVSIQELPGGEDGGQFEINADTAGFWGINLATLPDIDRPYTDQLHFRWRDDTTALNTSGGWLAAEDTVMSSGITKNQTYRIRMEAANRGNLTETASRTYELQYGDRSGFSSCSQISSWTGVADSADAFSMVDSSQITSDGQSTTAGLLANSESYTRVNGEGRDVADTTGSIGPLASDNYTELEYSIQATDDAVTGRTYCFRLYDTTASAALDRYSKYPRVTISHVAAAAAPSMEWGTQSNVSDDSWTTINFTTTFSAAPVFICTVQYDNNIGNESVNNADTGVDADSIVCRVQSVSTSSAQVRLQEPGVSDVQNETIHWLAVVPDEYDSDDIKMEAFTFSSTVTDENNSWVGQSQSYTQSYTDPVVLSQVMTYNDSSWSVAYCRGASQANPPDSTNFICGKHVGEDTDTTRSTETVGVVVIEQGSGGLGTNEYEAWSPTANSIDRIDNSQTDSYTFDSAFSTTPTVGLLGQAGINGGDGPHPTLYGSAPLTTTVVKAQTMEDEIGDSEQTGNSEVNHYLVLEDAGTYSATEVALDQTTYRFYDNADSVQPGTAKAAENTEITGVASNDVIRIRTSVQVGLNNLPAGALAFKLQYGQGSTCSAIGTWTDVGASGSGTIWRGYDNASPADGATVTSSLLNATTNALESYEEQNNSVNNPTAITKGLRGEWDWVVQNNGATATTDYCFRMTLTDSSVIQYTNYPQLTTASGGSGITISGTSNLSSGTVAVAVNGVLQSGKTGSISGGTWSISSVTAPSTGDLITVWVDGATDANESTAVTKYDGSGDVTGLVLDQHVLSIGNADDQSLTVANLGLYDNDQDDNIMHSANSSVLLADDDSAYSDEKIDILSGNTLTIGASETLTTHDLAINGTLTSGGASTYNVSGSWDNNSTFTASTSSVTFTAASGSETIDSTGATAGTFYDLTFGSGSGTATWSLSSALDVDGDLAVDYGTLSQGDNAIDLEGDLTVGSGGTLAVHSSAAFQIAGSWANSGTFTHNSGTVTFDSTDTGETISDGGSAFNNIIFNGSGGDWLYTDGASTAPSQTTVQAGTPTFLNAKTGTVSVTGGTLNVDWYLGTHVVDADNTSTDIDTGDNDVTILEAGSNSTVWEHNGSDWGSAASFQTTGTNASGDNPQPNNSGAIRIREYSMTASASCPGAGCTIYRYNEQIAWTGSYGEYDYHDDYGENYLTSCLAGSTAACSDDTTDDDVIGVGWYRSTIGTMNSPLSTVNEPPANGSWHAGMLPALSFSIDYFSRDFGAILPGSNPTDVTNTLTASSSASHGYVIYAREEQDMTCSNSLACGTATISDWSGTNASPTTWSGGSFGFGYSTNDHDLQGGTANRFSGPNFAGFVETGFGDPVADRAEPSSDQENVITYRIAPGAVQTAGPYQTSIIYVIVPTY